MSQPVPDDRLARAVLDGVKDKNYPEEDVVSSTFLASAIPGTLKLIDDARKDVEVWVSLSLALMM